jgi:porin
MGIGIAYSWLNQNIFNRHAELMYQGYYQCQIVSAFYLEPAVSYISTPGDDKNLSAAWAGTLRGILVF